MAAKLFVERIKNYVGGKWVDSTSKEVVELTNPATGERLGSVPVGTAADVDAAVKAAAAAFPAWSETPTLVEDWSKLQNGALFDTQPVLRFPIVWPNFTDAHEAYVRSVVYDFEVIRRYVERFLNDDSLVVVLGDHQPVVEISGDERARGVPVHVFSKNKAFVEAFLRRGYVPGMWPNGKATPRGMETFLPDLLRDFSTAP